MSFDEIHKAAEHSTPPDVNVPQTWDIDALIVTHASTQAAGVRQKLAFSGTGSFAGDASYILTTAGNTSTAMPTTRTTSITVSAEYAPSNVSASSRRIGTLTVTSAGVLSVQFASQTATSGVAALLGAPSYLQASKRP